MTHPTHPVVLGLHALSHDAGACLVTPGGIFAVSEERLSRRKHDGEFPQASIDYVLRAAGLSGPESVDLVVFDHLNRRTDGVRRLLDTAGLGRNAAAVRHHDAHAASAFFLSPFDDAAILIVDGGGSWGDETNPGEPPHPLFSQVEGSHELQTTWRGAANSLSLIRRTVATPSYRMGVGFFYAFACMHLGFGDLEGGKLMGLAPYGGSSSAFTNPIFEDHLGDWVAFSDRDFYDPANWPYYSKIYFRSIPPRAKDAPILRKHAEIAHYTQRETERVLLDSAAALHEITQSPNLCMSGGVALNSVANRLILEHSGFSNLFVQPAANDSGTPLGCALYGYHVLLKQPRRFRMDTAFLGRAYSPAEIDAALDGLTGCSVAKPADLLDRVAAALDSGKIVAWFEGPSEIGPRALGHRSLLADPRRPGMRDYLNSEVKFRESFRPYAPSILLSHVGDYFEQSDPSPFMLLVSTVRPDRRAEIPAVTHVDGTSRLQTVTPDTNGRFHDLIAAFHKRTGVPLVLNTSFNLAGEPIVESPADAVQCFLKAKIDCLVLEDYLIEKK